MLFVRCKIAGCAKRAAHILIFNIVFLVRLRITRLANSEVDMLMFGCMLFVRFTIAGCDKSVAGIPIANNVLFCEVDNKYL